ncbi:MAG: DUF4254 domain-containing protein, partial [Betaproteobacteria bacterium]
RITSFHDGCVSATRWYAQPIRNADGVWHWIETNHRCNSELWDEEDLARRLDVEDSAIAANKRRIDVFNQKRNDAVERIDDLILQALAATMNTGARLNAETAGMMIDRLSILSLKLKAMHQQTLRADVNDNHLISCRQKLERLVEQRNDLSDCFDALLAECQTGRARYKIYRQFKMYNDPALNPALYGSNTNLITGSK